MFNFSRILILLFSICSLVTAGEQTSTVSITIRVFSTFDSSAVKSYAAVLYDSSGVRIDSLVAVDTNVVHFSSVPITAVHSSGESPTRYFLGQNYPNPFNPSSRIQFTVPQAGPVSFKTYTILGQEDASLEMTLEPGNYEVQYSPGRAAGVIFYRLIAKDFSQTKKMIQFGGGKSGKSKLTLVSSSLQSLSQSYRTAAGVETNYFMAKLYNLPTTYLPIGDTAIQIAGLVKDTTLNIYLAEAKGFPCPGKPTITFAGKIYTTVLIGTQCWLKENLNVGTMIQGSQEQTNNGVIEKHCYNNDTANCNLYGGLYLWNEAMQYTIATVTQGICPSGWHIPTSAELGTLLTTVGGDGNALKAIGQDSTSTGTSGFSALLAGVGSVGSFSNLGVMTVIWSSSTGGSTVVADALDLEVGRIWLWGWPIDNGSSVRCLLSGPNGPPFTPSHPTPRTNVSSVYTSPTLRWSCSDPEGDSLTYDVYFGTDNPPMTKVDSNIARSSLLRIGLSDSTTYYWKIVAKDNHGNSTTGPVWSFKTGGPFGIPCPGMPTVTYAGRTYNTVQIGTQCWLRENLDVGTRIDDFPGQTNNGTIEKYCYNNDTANCSTYGGLYQWNEAMQYVTTAGTQGICPSGWHIPTSAELGTLSNTVGGDGNALKAVGQDSTSTGTSGFSALLAGDAINLSFENLGVSANFWSSTLYPHWTTASTTLELDANTMNITGSGASHGYGLSVRCILGDGANDPPGAPSNPSPGDKDTAVYTSPELQWSCTDPEGDPLTYDVYFGTDNPPVMKVDSNSTSDSLGLTGLSLGTSYYWKIVAKDNHGNVTQGSVWSFVTASWVQCSGSPRIEYAGKTYNTVQIGTQCWLKENLNVGTMVDSLQAQTNNGAIEKYCYHDDTANCTTHGGYYQWNEAMQYSTSPGTQGICPSGWHIPTLDEFSRLVIFVDGDGNALKAMGQDSTSTNTSGFSALLNGIRAYYGSFQDMPFNADVWSSTESGEDAYPLFLYANLSFYRVGPPFIEDKTHGLNIRCIKN